MDVVWTFKDYVSPNGRNVIKDWSHKTITVEARADFDFLIETIRKILNWEPRDFRGGLKGYPGLSEIKFKSGKKQHRVIGCFAPEHTYILLLGCTHKQGIYDPPDALNTARERKRKLAKGEASICEHTF